MKMKNISKIFLFSFFTILSTSMFAQKKKVVDSCNVLSKDYIFSKSRVIEVKSKKKVTSAIYSVMLNRGTTYQITACKKSDSKSDMEVHLLDSRDRMIMTNYNAEKQKYYSKMTFNCNASGKYYLHYIFDGQSLPGKGESTIGYKVNKKRR